MALAITSRFSVIFPRYTSECQNDAKQILQTEKTTLFECNIQCTLNQNIEFIVLKFIKAKAKRQVQF